MANVKKIRQSVLGALMAIAGLNIFTACYGMPPGGYPDDKVISGVVTDEAGAPINGIQVSVDGQRFAQTDEGGNFGNAVKADKSTFELTFLDTDGQQNGGLFEEQSITVDVPDYYRTVKVTLKKVK